MSAARRLPADERKELAHHGNALQGRHHRPEPAGQVYRCVVCTIVAPLEDGFPLDATIKYPSWRCKDTEACVERFRASEAS